MHHHPVRRVAWTLVERGSAQVRQDHDDHRKSEEPGKNGPVLWKAYDDRSDREERHDQPERAPQLGRSHCGQYPNEGVDRDLWSPQNKCAEDRSEEADSDSRYSLDDPRNAPCTRDCQERDQSRHDHDFARG